MGRRRRNRPNATGRSTHGGRFVGLRHRLLSSNAYRALSPNARSLLVELVMLHNGENNGSLYLSVRDAAARMGLADLSAAGKAFAELEDLGFIVCTADAHFHVKAAERSRARCWRLTFEAGPGRKGPTMDFLEREPQPKTRARKRMERGLRALKLFRKMRDAGKLPVLNTDTLSTLWPQNLAQAVSNSNTPKAQNGSFPPIPFVRNSCTHTATPYGEGASHSLVGWWQPDWSATMERLAYAAALAKSTCAQEC